MLQESNRIIVVDNEQSDLNQIAYEFNKKGIGCHTILYDGLNFPEEPYSDVRIAFFDVNLAFGNVGTSSSDPKQCFSILENAIASYISPNNGPFVLIFWTSNKGLIQDFINYINRDPNTDNLVRDRIKPYYISCLNKLDVSAENTLEDMLKKEFDNSMVNLCVDFDRQLQDASIHTINKLLSLIPMNDPWGNPQSFEYDFKKLFSKIAIASGGENSSVNTDRSINEALAPIIQHSLRPSSLWQDYLKIGDYSKEDIKNLVSKNVEKELNAIFFVDESIVDKKERGCLLKIKREKFEALVGIEFDQWRKNEFGESPKLEGCFPVAVEISSACDFSQNKSRTNKYLLGIAHNQEIKIKEKESNLQIDDFIINDILYSIAFDFNFILVDITEDSIENILFGFKKEMMDMIGNRYANHISRIGITSFR